MGRRLWIWTGAVITVVAVGGLAVYFARVGLDDADKAGSVVGGLAAVVGLSLAAYGVVAGPDRAPRRVSQRATASGRSSIRQVGGNRRGRPTDAAAPGRVDQRARASDGSRITQVGGDQDAR